MSDLSAPKRVAQLIVSPKAYARQGPLLSSLRWLRQNRPLARVEVDGFDPFWIVVRHADIVRVSSDATLFHNADRSTTLVPLATDRAARELMGGSPHIIRSIIQMDAPDHPKYRQVAQSWFAKQDWVALETRIRSIARDCVRPLYHRPVCEFVEDVARRFPLRVLVDLLGLGPEDCSKIAELTRKLFGTAAAGSEPGRHAEALSHVYEQFRGYFEDLAAERKRAPTEDLFSAIVTAQIEAREIGPVEAFSYLALLNTAGHDTTASAIAGGVWALCDSPALLPELRKNSGLITRFVEEAVRWTTPVQHFMRTATAAAEICGQQIAPGDWIMLSYLSGNRDGEAFADPDTFDIFRTHRSKIAFGLGAHSCLGQHLARLEMRVFFEELLATINSVELAGQPRRTASLFVGGPQYLPVKFGRRDLQLAKTNEFTLAS